MALRGHSIWGNKMKPYRKGPLHAIVRVSPRLTVLPVLAMSLRTTYAFLKALVTVVL